MLSPPRPGRGARGGVGAACALALALTAAPAAAGAQAIEFRAADAGTFPAGWKARDDAARGVYAVRAPAGDAPYLHAESRNDGYQIGLEIAVDPREAPWLRFSWRALTLPAGADERRKQTNDSALGVYVVFEGWGIPPKTLKYVWSTGAPAGTAAESPFTSRVKIVVVRSGPELAGRWVEERVNVRDDYRRLFGEDEAPKIKGIGVLTDSDNTGTTAAGDYRWFAFGAAP